MAKPYWSGPARGGTTHLADDHHEGYGGYDHQERYDPPTVDLGGPAYFADSEDYPDQHDYDDYDGYGYGPDTRWRWVAALAGVVLLVALVAIAVATRGGDASTRSATPSPVPGGQDALSTTPRTVIATVPPTSAAPVQELPPETIVTVTPTPSAQHTAAEPPPPPPEATAPPAQTITYTVTGTRQLFDLVTIFYTDEQGFPRTDVNVALPWTRTIVLNPGVEAKSVTATSLTGQLNCTVTDGTGATLAAQSNNAAIASCTQ